MFRGRVLTRPPRCSFCPEHRCSSRFRPRRSGSSTIIHRSAPRRPDARLRLALQAASSRVLGREKRPTSRSARASRRGKVLSCSSTIPAPQSSTAWALALVVVDQRVDKGTRTAGLPIRQNFHRVLKRRTTIIGQRTTIRSRISSEKARKKFRPHAAFGAHAALTPSKSSGSAFVEQQLKRAFKCSSRSRPSARRSSTRAPWLPPMIRIQIGPSSVIVG